MAKPYNKQTTRLTRRQNQKLPPPARCSLTRTLVRAASSTTTRTTTSFAFLSCLLFVTIGLCLVSVLFVAQIDTELALPPLASAKRGRSIGGTLTSSSTAKLNRTASRRRTTRNEQQAKGNNKGLDRPPIRRLIAPNGTILLVDQQNVGGTRTTTTTGSTNNRDFIQSLLDFAIVGFGKCGTSTLLQWFNLAPQIKCLPDENWELMLSRPDNLIRWLYHELPADTRDVRYKRCYKNPADITQHHILQYYAKYWPKTKLIVSLRHPVRYFESLYVS